MGFSGPELLSGAAHLSCYICVHNGVQVQMSAPEWQLAHQPEGWQSINLHDTLFKSQHNGIIQTWPELMHAVHCRRLHH